MSDFMKSIFKIALPVTIQCMLQSSFSIVDQLMIGQLGKESISAVGLCGNYSLIFSVVIGAVCSVAGILVSQFLGANDKKEAWGSLNLSMLICLVISMIFTLSLLLFTEPILGLYTDDKTTIIEGIKYCKIVSFACIPIGICSALSVWLRSREHAVFPLVATFGGVIVNTCLNYVLIFGKFGMPKLQIKGAAYATIISQILTFVLVVAGFIISNMIDKEPYQFHFRIVKVTIREYIFMIVPILISEFLWSLGQNVESAVYGHLGADSLPAYTLTCSIQGLFIGALSGLSAAAGVLVGKRLGKKEYDGAYEDSKKIMFFGFIGAVVLAIIIIYFSNFYVDLFKVNDTVKEMGRLVLIVFALYSPFKVLNMILGGGIIKSGGDTVSIMVIDIVGTWLVGIPLCLLAAYVLKLNLVWVYGILTSEEIFRFIITYIVFKRKKWMNSLA